MCRVQHPTQHTTRRFGDKSHQARDCTGNDYQTHNSHKNIHKHKHIKHTTLILTQIYWPYWRTYAQCIKINPKPKQKELLMCLQHCVQLWYTIHHRSVLMIFPVILQTIRWCLSDGRGQRSHQPNVVDADHNQTWSASGHSHCDDTYTCTSVIMRSPQFVASSTVALCCPQMAE